MATKFLVCLALLGIAAAVPLSSRWTDEETSSDSRDCAIQCSDTNNKFQYRPGTTYIYQYEVNTETSMAGASEDSALLNIRTHAEIEVMNACDFTLHLKSTQVSFSDPYMRELKIDRESEYRQILQRNLLRFSFNDGTVDSICPETDEEIWVLNFKRGLLSAFQNSMKDFERNQKVLEVDVTGICEEVEYNVSKSWSWRKKTIDVSKSKNLMSCSQREGFKTIIQMVPYATPAEIQSMPIIKSTHTCEQKINSDRILQMSSCKETHVYAPFANQQSGGRTVVTQKLTFQSKKDSIDTLQGVVHSRHSLLFQHMNGNDEILRGQEAAEQKLKEICEQTALDIRPETPRLFAELVQIVKTLELPNLRGIYQKLRKDKICPQNEKALKFFLDALPVAGTPGTVEMMLIAFKQNKVNEIEKDAWLMSLSLINEPSDEMMPLVLKLLKEPLTLRALLPASALVNNYCQMNAKCTDNYYVSEVIDLLDEKIDFYCATNEKNKHLVFNTLRAIGNIGSTRKLVLTLDRCIRSKYSPLEVKLSAIDAYRRIPCPDEMKETDTTLILMLQEKNNEPEVRIASYQALMRCPTDKTIEMMVKQLDSEETEEVGEYIYSHLKNLMKTSDPHKQDISKVIRRFTLTNKFEGNLRSSRNYESSLLMNKFNLGYSADADLIWSKSSLLPKTLKANLTLALFGKSINLLDFGGRMEGIEYLVTTLLGPNKYLMKEDKQWTADDLKLCLYGRIFGNEMAFKHIEGGKDLPWDKNQWNLPEMLIKFSKKFNYDFSHSMQLFHGSMIVPTIAGLPMNITVNSSASVHVGAKGQIDMNKMLTRHRSFNIEFDIIASAGLEVTGSMLVDAHFRKMGLRMRNTLHSSLPLKGHSSMSPAQGFSFEFDTPQDKIELFDARSKFFIIYDTYEKEQKMITENRKEIKKCTGDTLVKISGFEMCAELQFPNASMKSEAPYFPLTGPTSVNLVLHKKDSHSGYKVFAKWEKKKVHTIAQLQFNTPGSKTNRLISTDITLGHQKDKHVDIILITPWKKMNLNGKLIVNKNIRRMVGSARIDEEDYGFTTELARVVTKKDVKYSPLVEIIYKGESKTLLAGQIKMVQMKDISMSLDVRGLDKALGNIKGALINTGKQKRATLEVTPSEKSSFSFTAGSDYKIDKRGIKLVPDVIVKSPKSTLLSVKGTVECRYDKLMKGDADIRIYSLNPISLNTELKKAEDSKRGKSTLTGKVKVKSTNVNVDLSTLTGMDKKLINSRLKLKYDIESLGQDFIRWTGKFSDKSKKLFKQYKIYSNLSFKKNSNYNTLTNLDIHQKKETKLGLNVKYGKNLKLNEKQVNLAIQFPNSIPNTKNAKMYGIITASVPEKKWDMEMKLNHVHDKEKLDSKINFHFLPFVDKSTIIAQTKLNPKDFTLTGSYSLRNKKVYSVDVLSKMRNWNAGRWSVEATSPNREIKAKASIRKDGERVTGDALVNWDAGKKKRESSEMSVTGVYKDSKVNKGLLMRGSLQFKSPFKNLENVNLKMNLDQQLDRLKSNSKISWGGKQDQLNVDLITTLPLTISQVKLLLAVKSPFKGYRQVEVDIDHQLSKELLTILRGKLNNAQSEITLKGNGDMDETMRNIKGEISLKTPLKNYRAIQLTLDHTDDYKIFKTRAGITHNKKEYMANLNMKHNLKGQDIVNSGKLIITYPENSVETTWNHHTENEMKKIASKLRSTSNNKEIIDVKVSGSYDDTNSVKLDIDMDTKWKAVRKLGFQIKHNIKNDLLTSKAILTRNRFKTGYDLNMLNEEGNSEVNLILSVNPLYRRDIILRSNVKYEFYPMTATAEIEWAPRTQIAFEGSMNAPSYDNFDLSSKLTTPFEDYENIHMKSSIKEESSELIAHLNIDYAIKKMIDIETRFRNDESFKLIGAKMITPCPNMEYLYTGIQLDMDNKMELKADLDLRSHDRYGSHIVLKKVDEDLSGKVKIITPIDGYKSIEANGQMNTKRNSRRTVHLDLKAKNKVYSFDSSLKTQMPIQLNINIRTPHPEFDDVGLIFSHDMPEGKIVSVGSITFLPKKTIEASIDFLYTPKIDGSLRIKTPFKTFEENNLNIRYNGELNDFDNHFSVLVAEKQVSCDLKFKNLKYRTSGGLDFVSPLKGLEKIKSNFMVRGKLQNIRGEAFFQYGDKKFSTELSHKWKRDSLNMEFKFTPPGSKSLHICIDHIDKNTRNKIDILHKQMWKWGDEKVELMASINHENFEKTSSLIKVNSTCDGLLRNVTINMQRTADVINFSWLFDMDSKYINELGLIFRSKGPIDNINSLFNLTWEDQSLIEITVETNKLSDKDTNGKVTLRGHMLPDVTTEMKFMGDGSLFTAKAKASDDNEFYYEVKGTKTDKIYEWDAVTSYNIFKSCHSTKIYFKRDVTEDFGLIIKVLTEISDDKKQLYGFEIEHKGNLEKFTTSNKYYFGKRERVVSHKVEFFRDGWERVEIDAELNTPFKYLDDLSLKYRLEGQDTRMSHNLNLVNGKNEQIVITLLLESDPHTLFSLLVEEPHKSNIVLLLSTEIADGKLSLKTTLENEPTFSLLGVYSDSVYPYHPHLHLVTPLKWLKDLTINIKGKPMDTSADLTLLLNDNDNVEGKVVFKYENLFSLRTMLSMDSTFENFKDLLLELKNTEEPYSKKSALTLELGPDKKISISGDYLSKDEDGLSNIDKQLVLCVILPLEKVQSMTLNLGLQGQAYKADGQIGFDLNSQKILDLDLNYNIDEDKSISLIVRKPQGMEYSLNQNNIGDATENVVYLNWNRNEPDSNIRIKSTFKDISDSSKIDRSTSLTLSLPVQSIGLEHSHLVTSRSIVSTGKLFWNTDDDSKIFYDLNLEDKSGRRFTFVNGDLKLGGPMRTIGLSGNLRNSAQRQISDVTFSWDLDNDKSKQITLNTKVSGDDQMNADFTLQLPAQVKVDSKLVLNKGNTIFDGTTDISYSWDDRKTLTLFSKLENNPGSYGYFSSPDRYNYSIQFGIKHPDTKIDMTFDSHLGNSEDHLTSSLGLDYLTSHRQKKNMALWLEIDKLKKEISLISTNPYNKVRVTGTVLGEEPLKLQAVATIDDEETFKTTLDVNTIVKKALLSIEKSGNDVVLTLAQPTKSAIKVDVDHQHIDGSHREAALTMTLASSRLLLANLEWRPELLKDIQNSLIQTITLQSESVKELASELTMDVEKEITRKYNDLTSAIVEDAKPLVDFVKGELNTIQRQMKILKRRWRRSEINNDMYLGDLMKVLNDAVDSITSRVNIIHGSLMEPLNTLPEKLEALKNYPVRKTYRDTISNSGEKIDEISLVLTQIVRDIRQHISELKEYSKNFIAESVEELAEHPWIEAVTDRLQVFKTCDISPQVKKVIVALKNGVVVLGENDAIKALTPYMQDLSGILRQYVIDSGALGTLRNASNEVYQQVKWAYNYWEAEDNLPDLLQSSLITVQEVLEEEAIERMGVMAPFMKNPITLYDPERGILKAAIILPIDVESLDKMPDLRKYIMETGDSVQQYITILREYLPDVLPKTRNVPYIENKNDDRIPVRMRNNGAIDQW